MGYFRVHWPMFLDDLAFQVHAAVERFSEIGDHELLRMGFSLLSAALLKVVPQAAAAETRRSGSARAAACIEVWAATCGRESSVISNLPNEPT